jgi:small-conductance mechanosensitive channel
VTVAAVSATGVLIGLAGLGALTVLARIDNQTGVDVPANPRQSSARRWARNWLGLDQISIILQRIEDTMANEMIDLLQGLAAQTSDLTATQQAAFTNIHNGQQRLEQQIGDLKQQLTDALNSGGKVTPEMQAAADQISQAMADLKKAATVASSDFDSPASDEGDNGGQAGDVPPANTDQPVPPADGGDTPDNADGGDVPPVVNSRR